MRNAIQPVVVALVATCVTFFAGIATAADALENIPLQFTPTSPKEWHGAGQAPLKLFDRVLTAQQQLARRRNQHCQDVVGRGVRREHIERVPDVRLANGGVLE